MEQQELNQLIQDYERLFHKVLQRCSLFPGQVDYEDHLQELRLLFLCEQKNTPRKANLKWLTISLICSVIYYGG